MDLNNPIDGESKPKTNLLIDEQEQFSEFLSKGEDNIEEFIRMISYDGREG